MEILSFECYKALVYLPILKNQKFNQLKQIEHDTLETLYIKISTSLYSTLDIITIMNDVDAGKCQ